MCLKLANCILSPVFHYLDQNYVHCALEYVVLLTIAGATTSAVVLSDTVFQHFNVNSPNHNFENNVQAGLVITAATLVGIAASGLISVASLKCMPCCKKKREEEAVQQFEELIPDLELATHTFTPAHNHQANRDEMKSESNNSRPTVRPSI